MAHGMEPGDSHQHKRGLHWSVGVPLVTAIVGGLIAFGSNIYTTYGSNMSQLAVEQRKPEANLIIEAVKTGDQQKAIQNLDFFLKAGFLSDLGGKIKQLVSYLVVVV